jgi:hypothetical protein
MKHRLMDDTILVILSPENYQLSMGHKLKIGQRSLLTLAMSKHRTIEDSIPLGELVRYVLCYYIFFLIFIILCDFGIITVFIVFLLLFISHFEKSQTKEHINPVYATWHEQEINGHTEFIKFAESSSHLSEGKLILTVQIIFSVLHFFVFIFSLCKWQRGNFPFSFIFFYLHLVLIAQIGAWRYQLGSPNP